MGDFIMKDFISNTINTGNWKKYSLMNFMLEVLRQMNAFIALIIFTTYNVIDTIIPLSLSK